MAVCNFQIQASILDLISTTDGPGFTPMRLGRAGFIGESAVHYHG